MQQSTITNTEKNTPKVAKPIGYRYNCGRTAATPDCRITSCWTRKTN